MKSKNVKQLWKEYKDTQGTTPEVVKELINEWCSIIESNFGEEAVVFYRAGILDAIELIQALATMQEDQLGITRSVELQKAFSWPSKKDGGIN